MAWREYYTLEEAAHVLSQKLKAVYTIADLMHYGALGIVEYCVPVPNIRFFKRSLAELYYLPDNTRRPLIIQKVLYSAPFAPIPNILMQEIEIYGSAKLTACPHLIDYSGSEISAALVGLEDLGIHKSFNNFELKIPRQSINGKLRVGVRTVQCNSVQDVIDAQRHHKKIDGVLSGIKNFKNDGWFYQFIPETAIYDFINGYYPDRGFLEGTDWSLEIDIGKLRIMSSNLAILEKKLREKTQGDIEIQENIQVEKNLNEKPMSLKLANKAYTKFWGNANPLEKDTHPDNADIATWVISQPNNKITPTMASRIAQVIRPEWASTGRKPQK